jgi:tyrosyl-tRNA synthetase
MKNIVEEFKWRGLYSDSSNGTEEQLNKEQTSVYIGFDPTADSLHIGSLVPIIMLKHLERFNHKPIVLVGGATGMIGDPSGKSSERNQLSDDILDKNYQGVLDTLKRFLPNASYVNNHTWISKFSLLDFISSVGKMLTVNYMMAKESVKSRIEGGGMSFTEFTYQLIQGYDFLHLYENNNCKVQMGGSDQFGNMTTGMEMIRKKGGHGFVLTCPLLTKSDGTKFGKSEGGNIWLDANKTSVFSFYQFWLNQSDEDSERFIKIFTFLDKLEIENIISEHNLDKGLRILQKKLAQELTIFVHSQEELDAVIMGSDIIFGKGKITHQTNMGVLTDIVVDHHSIMFKQDMPILEFLILSNFLSSNNERRRGLTEGSILINKNKVNLETIVTKSMFISDHLLLQRGKKAHKILILS